MQNLYFAKKNPNYSKNKNEKNPVFPPNCAQKLVFDKELNEHVSIPKEINLFGEGEFLVKNVIQHTCLLNWARKNIGLPTIFFTCVHQIEIICIISFS